MHGVSVVKIVIDDVKKDFREIVTNIDDNTEKIIRYFGAHAMAIYDVS